MAREEEQERSVPMMFARVTLTLLAALVAGSATAAPKAAPHPAPLKSSPHPMAHPSVPASAPAIMPVSQVRAGMKGYGLTVFRGTKIERFGFEVLGVLPKANQVSLSRPLILVRMWGGPMTSRGANLIQGMSGSPCYINDRLIGAFAWGDAGAKEPIGMLTPIEDMLEALDSKLPDRPLGTSAAEFGVGSEDTASVGYRPPDWMSDFRLFGDSASLEVPALGGTRFEHL